MSIQEAFRAEGERLSAVVLGLTEEMFDRPTGCPPWTVRDLLAHVRTATGRLIGMLNGPAPTHAEVDTAGYYAPAKFTPETDSARVGGAQREAVEMPSGRALAEDFDRTWRMVSTAVAAAQSGRLVRTRHGDAMTVDDFLATRVVELGVHGLDLADALGRPYWLTDPAATLIADLVAGRDGVALADGLGWDRLTLIGKATGRAEVTDAEQAEVDRRGVRWLAFG